MQAGPAIVLSFAIAGFASILAGLSYAEFGSRVPRAGSAYVYSFVAVGELVAWITGWNLILEYIIGASSVARGWSSYFDALTGHFIEQKINSVCCTRSHVSCENIGNNQCRPVSGFEILQHMPVVMGQHTDIFAFFVTMVLTLLVGLGVKESTRTNNVLTAVNLIVVTFVVIAGLFYVDFSNWKPFGKIYLSTFHQNDLRNNCRCFAQLLMEHKGYSKEQPLVSSPILGLTSSQRRRKKPSSQRKTCHLVLCHH